MIHFKSLKSAALTIIVLLMPQIPLGSVAWAFDLSLVGGWEFAEIEIDGHRRPALDPDFKMIYEFKESGDSRLQWRNDRLKGFCEREGKYLLQDNYLVDEVVWLNPKNTLSCANDPDMQLNLRSVTPIELSEQKLKLHLMLGDKPVIYHWEKR